MRSGVVIAAFAAGAMAVPYKRDVVTDVDVVYATDVVTVTATGGEVTATADAVAATTSTAETSSFQANAHYGHHGGWSQTWTWTSQAEPTSTASSTFVAPTSSAMSTLTSTYVAPTTSTSTYVAPTTSTSVYVAPTTSKTSTTSSSPTSVWVAPTSVVSAATSAVSSVASAIPTDYAGIAILHHNIHRANHSADPIAWSDDLASSAATIAASCVYAHNTDVAGGGYGQNIAAGVEGNNISAIITDLFYNGEVGWYADLYGQAQPSMTDFEHWGHFSQIVWKDTKFVGCATQHCPNGLANVGSDVAPYFTVCNYKGPGNYANEYGANIGSPLNQPTAQWNTGLSLS